MRNNEIKKNYLKKIKEIIKLNESYYDKNSPLVLDSEYDLLKNEILNLEKKYKFLDHENSPSKIVGFKPSKTFQKINHKVPMLSLANAFTENDLMNFEKKIINFLNEKKILKLSIALSLKLMGYLHL